MAKIKTCKNCQKRLLPSCYKVYCNEQCHKEYIKKKRQAETERKRQELENRMRSMENFGIGAQIWKNLDSRREIDFFLGF